MGTVEKVITLTAVLLAAFASLSQLRLNRAALRAQAKPDRLGDSASRARITAGRLAVALFALLSLVALAVVLGVNNGDEQRASFPDAAEGSLLAILPEAQRRSCQRGESRGPGVIAAVICDTPAPLRRALYELFAAPGAAQRRFNARRTRAGLPEGDCSTATSAWKSYTQGGSSNPAGLWMCFTDSQGEHVEWSQDALRVFASVSAPLGKRRRLHDFWRKAGPSSSYNRQAFPDYPESQLLALLARGQDKRCQRNKFQATGLRASIICRGPRDLPGVGVKLFYVRFADKSALVRYFRGRIRDIGNPDGSCARDRMSAVQSIYRIDDARVGRRLCYESGKQASVEWSDNRYATYGLAQGKADLYDVYDWWLDSRGHHP